MIPQRFRLGLCLCLTLLASNAVSGLGTEVVGNEPLPAANYKDWPGIMPVVNHPSRVFQQWVNGNESCYYQGDTTALNDTLQKFAGTQVKDLEVVLRPGPAETRSFSADRTIPYRWQLRLIGGIARFLTSRDRGTQVWADHPVLHIYVGEGIDLAKLVMPAGVKVSGLAEVKQRMRKGFRSTDKTVRGWTAGELAALDPYDDESRDAIGARLKDEDMWVRQNAAHALAFFGGKAAPLLPALREQLATENAPLKDAAQTTIREIEAAESREPKERAHKALLLQIGKYLDGLPRQQ